jgi:tRNA (adenine57-N1/adenine58-N1)-methyltransferase
MTEIRNSPFTQPGDLAQLVSPSNKFFTVRLTPGGQLQTHRGIINYDDLIGLPWGTQVFSHKGSAFFLLQPALGDLLRDMKRSTQIMYPKDIGFVLVSMGIGPGSFVVEAGTGSGAFTTALAWAVGPLGHITTYEIRPDTQKLAQKNLERLGLAERVTFKLKDISEGFDETGVDALFLDVQNSFDYIRQVRDALKSGGFFGSILPTVNQVSRLLIALHQYHFAFVDVCEVMLRYYKPVPERLRPTDRMVAHTGFLIFGRPMLASINQPIEPEDSSDRQGEFPDEPPGQEGLDRELFE